jgi:hypothetical protein
MTSAFSDRPQFARSGVTAAITEPAKAIPGESEIRWVLVRGRYHPLTHACHAASDLAAIRCDVHSATEGRENAHLRV